MPSLIRRNLPPKLMLLRAPTHPRIHKFTCTLELRIRYVHGRQGENHREGHLGRDVKGALMQKRDWDSADEVHLIGKLASRAIYRDFSARTRDCHAECCEQKLSPAI